jgi:hypothetical protein
LRPDGLEYSLLTSGKEELSMFRARKRSTSNTSRCKIPAFQSTQAVDEMDVLARQMYINIALHGASFVPSQMHWTNVYLLGNRRSRSDH